MNKKIIALIVSIISILIVGYFLFFHTSEKHLQANIVKEDNKQLANDVSNIILPNENIDISEPINDNNINEKINFEIVEKVINEKDCYGWLFIPDTNIDYIVMQGPEDDALKYLNKTPYGDDSEMGSLFVHNLGDIKDDHIIIYGHSLKNHDLYFGPLSKFEKQSYAKQHPYAYFYTKDTVTRYKLYSVNNGFETDFIYYTPYIKGTSDWTYLLDNIDTTSVVKLQDKYNHNKNMLVLSTCNGKDVSAPNRLYLIYEKDIEETY